MFGLNRFFGVRAPYEQHASDPGAGAGTGGFDAPASDQPSDGTGSPASGDPAGGPPAGASQTPPPAATLSPEDRQALDEYNRIRQDFGGKIPTRAELETLRRTVAAATGLQPGEQPEDPKIARIRQGLFNAVPGLEKLLTLVDRMDDIHGLLEQAPVLQQTSDTHLRNLARAAKDELSNSFAALALGSGKTGADLTDQQRTDLAQDFGYWLKAGGPDRVGRFEDGEYKALVGEFLNRSRSLWAPAARSTVAGHVARMPNAPGEGSSGFAPAGNRAPAPPNTAPQSNEDRLDAAIERAAAQMSNAGG